MILVCLLCTHGWHTFIRSPFACNAASCSVEVLLMSLRFSARLTFMFRLDCSDLTVQNGSDLSVYYHLFID